MVDDELGGEDLGAPGGGRNLKTIIIGAVVILAVGAGAFFAGRMMSGGGETQVVEKQNGQKATDGKTDGNANGSKNTNENKDNSTDNAGTDTRTDPKISAKNQQGVLALDTFTVNLNDPFGRRYIEVILNLIIEKKDLVPKIKENELLMPKIRHEVFMTISAKSYTDLKSTSGKVTLFEEIQMRVNEILKEHMGIEPVIEVIQTKFLIQ